MGGRGEVGSVIRPSSARAAWVLAVAALWTSCQADPGHTDASDATDHVDGSVAPDAGSLVFTHDWTEEALCAVEGGDVDCCDADRVELPMQAASVLDLRDLGSGSSGTCGEPTKLLLPGDRALYPLMIRLPAVPAPDPECGYCAGRGKETTFGIVLELPSPLVARWRPAVVAPPPWRYVYDHNGLASDACLGGYQEFGERACVRPNYGGYVGFATGQAPVDSRVALIDLIEGANGMVDTCCPFLATTP